MKKILIKLATIISLPLFISNCSNSISSDYGFIYTSVKFPSSTFNLKAIPSNTSIIDVEISGKGLSESIKLTLTKENPTIIVPQVPSGTKLIIATARDSSKKELAEGESSINVIAGKTNTVEITLKEVSSKDEASEQGEETTTTEELTENQENEQVEEVLEENSENDPNETTETPQDEQSEEVVEETAEEELPEDSGGGGGGSSSSTPRISTSISITEGSSAPSGMSIIVPTVSPTPVGP